MTTTPKIPVVVFDLPEDDGELEVSHIVRIGKDDYRVLKEAHQWHALQSAADPSQIIQAFVHPDDYPKLDRVLGARRRMGDVELTKLMTMILEKPTGHPTKGSSDSLST